MSTLRYRLWVVPLTLFFIPTALAALQVELDIKGGDDALRDNLRAHLEVGELPCDSSERQLLRKLRDSEENISRALRALGYYHGSWQLQHERSSRLEEGLGNKLTNQRQACWRVLLEVEPGAVTTISEMDVELNGEANQDPVFQEYLQALPLEKGDTLNHALYEDIKLGLIQRARNRGYFEAAMAKHQLIVHPERNQAEVHLTFNSGPRYRFGELNFSDSPLDRALLRRFLPFESGDYFDNNKLIDFQSKLISSAYFDAVSVDRGSVDNDAHAIPIEVITTAKERYETTAGIGVSTDTGPRLSYALHNRRVNPEGDTYQVVSQLSPVQSHLGFQYAQPRANPLTEKLLWSTGVEQEETDTAESISYRAEVALVDEISNGWLQTTSLRFLREDYEIADEERSTVMVIPEISWVRRVSNDPRYPTFGWRLYSAVRGSLKEVVSDITMSQVEVEGKLILPLFGGRVLSRANLAATALDEFEDLPASLRFFAGGDNSVRGYGYKDLGPENDDGEVIGGKHRFTASVEYDHKVWRDFALAAFYDVGNAFNTDDVTLYHSAGVGFRWFSPIGPVRIDLAFPLKESGYRIHLSMGPDL